MLYFWYPTSVKSPDANGPYLPGAQQPGAQQMDARPEVQPRMRREFNSVVAKVVSITVEGRVISGRDACSGVAAIQDVRRLSMFRSIVATGI